MKFLPYFALQLDSNERITVRSSSGSNNNLHVFVHRNCSQSENTMYIHPFLLLFPICEYVSSEVDDSTVASSVCA